MVGSIDEKLALKASDPEVKQEEDGEADVKVEAEQADENTPLLSGKDTPTTRDSTSSSRGWSISRRVAQAVLRGVQVVIATITAPGRYVIACFYDSEGHFSAILPLRNFKDLLSRRRRKSTAQAVGLSSAPTQAEEKFGRRTSSKRSTSVDSNASSSTTATSDGEGDGEKREDSPARHTRSRTAAAIASQDPAAISAPQHKKKTITIHGSTDEALRKRRAAKAAALQRKSGASPDDISAVASALKSPSSTNSGTISAKATRYPRAPAPPRPLVPRRQPSYTLSYSSEAPKKTLIIDLDETLIHSMAKGGRMSTGHMVEVRLGSTNPIPVATASPTPTHIPAPVIGPGVPILYYVHERPNCHEFLRKVSKWYNLVVFTASVQEYADPVIDWLERERRYFGGRYYRQHCTLRNGAYIKDLAQVEPDLSRVAILDNSPMSYIFHEGELLY